MRLCACVTSVVGTATRAGQLTSDVRGQQNCASYIFIALKQTPELENVELRTPQFGIKNLGVNHLGAEMWIVGHFLRTFDDI